MDWWRYEPNKANRISNYAPKCQYWRYMHVGHSSMCMACFISVLIMNIEVEAFHLYVHDQHSNQADHTHTWVANMHVPRILAFWLSLFKDWWRYEPNKANRISNYALKCQYRRYMHVGQPSMCMACLIWVYESRGGRKSNKDFEFVHG